MRRRISALARWIESGSMSVPDLLRDVGLARERERPSGKGGVVEHPGP